MQVSIIYFTSFTSILCHCFIMAVSLANFFPVWVHNSPHVFTLWYMWTFQYFTLMFMCWSIVNLWPHPKKMSLITSLMLSHQFQMINCRREFQRFSLIVRSFLSWSLGSIPPVYWSVDWSNSYWWISANNTPRYGSIRALNKQIHRGWCCRQIGHRINNYESMALTLSAQ